MVTSTLDLVRRLSHGPLPSDRALVSPSRQAEVAQAYADLPLMDEPRRYIWRAMAREVERQADVLESHGFEITSSPDDPYGGSARAMFESVDHRHIAVLDTATTGGHPVWTDEENNLFRAVHDVFGHYAAQRGFDRHGEEAAYRRHHLMFSGVARLAMATETRGQTAALIATGDFQAEKIALLPRHMIRDTYLAPVGIVEVHAALLHSQTTEIPVDFTVVG
jgi:hypothetical protein